MGRKRRWVAAGVLGVLALVVGALAGGFLLSSYLSAAVPLAPGAAGPRGPGAPASPRAPVGFVEFRDELFSIAYPASWQRLETRDPEVELLASEDRGASFEVRVRPLAVEIGPANLQATKRFTERIVKSGRRVKLLAPAQQSDLAGLPGYFYLYTFDDARGRRGAHSHYFLFRGDTMYTIVFQSLPADRLSALAPVFDRIADTFRPA